MIWVVTYEKFLTNPCLNKLSLLPIDEETTIKIIDGLKAKNSEGVDGLSVKLLKAIKYETSKAIKHLTIIELAMYVCITCVR